MSSAPLPSLPLRLRRFGFAGLFVYSSLGFGLEMLHAYKVDAYLNVTQDTRRLLFTLAHAHGSLLSILLLVVALHANAFARSRVYARGTSLLLVAQALLPAGFLLGGLRPKGGDPSPLGALIPLGALALLGGLGALAWASFFGANEDAPPREG